MLKWWVSDFGLTAGVFASAHLAIAGCLDARYTGSISAEIIESPIWMLVAISAVWSLMTYAFIGILCFGLVPARLVPCFRHI